MGPSWEYALIEMPETLSLAFQPYAVANSDYYSEENNKDRYNKCVSLCNNDFDCKWYCGQMRW